MAHYLYYLYLINGLKIGDKILLHFSVLYKHICIYHVKPV